MKALTNDHRSATATRAEIFWYLAAFSFEERREGLNRTYSYTEEGKKGAIVNVMRG